MIFRLLNKSAIWLLCLCVNHWLWNSSKWPFTGAFLQSSFPSNPLGWQPAMGGGWVRGWLVGRWCQISHTIQVRTFIHLSDAHSKQWAALIASSMAQIPLGSSRLDTFDFVEPVELVVLSESSCAVRLARHSRNAWARHVERVESCRVESSRAKWNLGL